MHRLTVFLTGGTGTLGRLIYERLARERVDIIMLTRNREPERVATRTEIVRGDLGKKYFGWPKKKYLETAGRADIILHGAASTKFNLPLGEARKHNVETSLRIMDFGRICQNLQRLGYISTAFVAGKRTGIIQEDDLEHRAGFVSTYEQSKYEAEMLVRSKGKDLPVTIFRPSLIDSSMALNWCLELLGKGLLPVIPGNADDRLDVIDGETAAEWIVRLLFLPVPNRATYHICRGQDSPTLAEIVRETEKRAGRRLLVKYAGDRESFDREVKKITGLRPEPQAVYSRMESFLPQLAYPKIFDNTHTRRDLHL